MDQSYKPQFKVPDQIERQNAFGKIAGLPIKLKKALQALFPLFSPIKPPGPHDWLANQEEEGQSYEAFEYQMKNQFSSDKTIYIQPLEIIDAEFLNFFQEICKLYFYGARVIIRKKIEIKADSRINPNTGKKQYNASQILKSLEPILPKNTYCLIGILMTDIYHKEDWNFVFGVASLLKKTGVFSLARYDEHFFDESYQTDKKIVLERATKVMIHEIGHMFGIRHCIYFDCLMNGSNNLEENTQKPLQFCPVCIRKLQSQLKFDVLERYEKLNEKLKNSEYLNKECEQYDRLCEAIRVSYGNHYQKKLD